MRHDKSASYMIDRGHSRLDHSIEYSNKIKKSWIITNNYVYVVSIRSKYMNKVIFQFLIKSFQRNLGKHIRSFSSWYYLSQKLVVVCWLIWLSNSLDRLLKIQVPVCNDVKFIGSLRVRWFLISCRSYSWRKETHLHQSIFEYNHNVRI